MTPWLCSCHNKQMYWNIDTRVKVGGFWECREKRRERNARRISMFGSRTYMPDKDFREFAIALRDERKKEARRGRTET